MTAALTLKELAVLPALEIEAPVHLIRDPDDARPIDMRHAANLAVSIKEVGLENPISLRVLRPDELNDDGCIWLRTRGGHRLAAFRINGSASIPAKVREEADEVAAIAIVDENLLRRDHTALERAQAFAERLAAWAVLHPDRVEKTEEAARVKRGRPKNSGKLRHLSGGTPPLMGFAEETASVAGISRDTVERALAVYRSIPPSLQARLHSTWIASNDAALRQLATIGDAGEQAAVIELMLAGKTKSIPAARAMVAGTPVPAKPTASQAVDADLRKLWGKATPSQRAAFLDFLAGAPLPKGWSVKQEIAR